MNHAELVAEGSGGPRSNTSGGLHRLAAPVLDTGVSLC
jgi:hypothetical protein